jgi:glycosyltransferase involved in cell wall biosynthesis
MLQFVAPLGEAAVSCTVKPLLSDAYVQRLYDSGGRSLLALIAAYLRRLLTLRHVFRYDLLWIEKELFPYLPAFAERLLALCGVRFVVDYDDAVFHTYDMSRSWWVRRLLGRKIDAVMASAHTVIAGNRYIAARAARAGSESVKIIPTVVDHQRYSPRKGPNDRPFTIGWIGSPATQSFLLDIADVLVRVCRRHDARLLLVGAHPTLARRFDAIHVEIRRWSEQTEQEDVAEMDVGIMPLEDKPWERGKCGYKLIQYMASGVAVCASPVGVNVDIVGTSGAGLLADSPERWEAALEVLVNDAEARSAMERRGRQAVVDKYSIRSQLATLLSILRQ